MRRIAIIQGHPDPAPSHLLHAMADAYAEGARAGGHEVRRIDVARLDFPLLRNQHEFERGPLPAGLVEAQAVIAWAEHLVVLYPLWLGTMPALFKGFLEQTLRPDFAFAYRQAGGAEKRLRGRSARVIVTMGMPALAYRFWFGAHSLKSFERNVLKFCGIGPVRTCLFGMVEAVGDAKRQKWLDALRGLGKRGT